MLRHSERLQQVQTKQETEEYAGVLLRVEITQTQNYQEYLPLLPIHKYAVGDSGRFQQNLQKFYCRYLFKKYFEVLREEKNRGSKQLSIRIEMFGKRREGRRLEIIFGGWRQQT